MPQSYNDVVATQIEAVTPLLTDFFDNEDALFSRFQKITSKEQSGRNIRMPIELRPGGTLRYVSLDNGALGVGTAPVYDFTAMSPVDTVYALSWSLKAKFTTDSAEKAVTDVVQRAIASGLAGAKIHVDKHLQTAGAGILGTSTTVGAQTAITMDGTANNFGSRLFRVGDSVQAYAVGDHTTERTSGASLVTNVNYKTKVVTITPATGGGLDAQAEWVVGGLGAANGTFIFGLPYHQNNSATGTWLTWNRADYPEVVTASVNANGASLTLEHINQLLTLVEGDLGEDVFNTGRWFWYTHPKQHYNLIMLMTMISEISLPMGGQNGQVDLTFARRKQRKLADFEIVTSINANPTRVDLIDGDNWLRGLYKDIGFLNLGGKTVLPVPNSTSYNATEISYLAWSHQFAMRNPRRGGYIYGLAEPF